MKISFWNTYRNKDINSFLIPMIIEKKIDIMILAEYEDNIDCLLNNLYINGESYDKFIPIACKKIRIVYRKDINVELNNDCSNYVSITINYHECQFELFATHLPSRLHSSEGDRNIVVRILKEDVEKYDKAVVVGDFNSNPFETTMVAFSGLMAIPNKECKKRKVQGQEKKALYNPMWRFFGDFETLPGTYYNNNGKDLNYYWNIFDQVVVSQDLVNKFDNNKLEIIKKIKNKNLIKRNIIDKSISDHLPIVFSLKED